MDFQLITCFQCHSWRSQLFKCPSFQSSNLKGFKCNLNACSYKQNPCIISNKIHAPSFLLTKSMHHPSSNKIPAPSFLQQDPCTILPPTKSLHHPTSNKIPASSYLQQNPYIILPPTKSMHHPFSNKIHASSFLQQNPSIILPPTNSMHHPTSNKIHTSSFLQQDPCTIHLPTKSVHHPSSNKIRTAYIILPQKMTPSSLPFQFFLDPILNIPMKNQHSLQTCQDQSTTKDSQCAFARRNSDLQPKSR